VRAKERADAEGSTCGKGLENVSKIYFPKPTTRSGRDWRGS
jgi:hypothetical protein